MIEPGDWASAAETDLSTMADPPGELPKAVVIPLARPAAPGGWDLLIGMVIVWAAELLLGVAAGLASAGIGRAEMERSAFALDPIAMIGASITSAAVAAVVSWYVLCRRYRRGFREGLGLARVGVGVLLLSAWIGLAGAIVGGITMGMSSVDDSVMARLAATPEGLAAICVLALVVPPLEEVYYRGFVFPILLKKIGGPLAILVIVCWFGGVHAVQLGGDWIGLGVVTTMGLVWTLLRYYSRSLVPSVIAHWMYNGTLVAASLIAR